MAVSDDLFRLIKSLTKSERRHFTLSSSLYDKEKLYMKLFLLIDAQTEYDESAIRSEFPSNQFSVAKTRLFQMIISSLVNFQSERNVDRQIREHLEQAEVLQNRNFNDAANKLFEKARQRSIKSGRYELALETLRLQQSKSFSGIDLNELFKLKNDLIRKIRKISQLKMFCSKLEQTFRERGFAQSPEDFDEYSQYVRNDFLLLDEGEVDHEFEFYFNLLHAWFYFVVKEPERVHEFLISILASINTEKRHEKDQIWQTRYGDVLLFYYRVCIYCKRETELEFIREELKDYGFNRAQQNDYFTIQMEDNLRHLNNVSDEFLFEIELKLDELDSEEHSDFRIFSLRYSLINYYFAQQQYRKSLKHSNAFLNHKNASTVFLYHGVVQLFVLSHLALKNYEIVTSELKTYAKKIQMNKDSFIGQMAFVEAFKQLSADGHNENILLSNYHLKIGSISEERRNIDIFDFTLRSWFDSQFGNKINKLAGT